MVSVMSVPDGVPPHGSPPAPREVTVVGTAPPSWRDRQVTGGVLAVLWIGVLFCALAGPTWLAIVLSVVLTIATALYAVGTWAIFSIIDDPEIKAGPDGIWAPGFTARWDEVRSCGFVEGKFRYGMLDPSRKVDDDDIQVSLVITKHEADANGRQIQLGYTLYEYHSPNLDEFMAVVRQYAPEADLRTGRSTADFIPNPQQQAALAQQWSTTGQMVVVSRRGAKKLTVDTTGFRAGRHLVPWADVARLVAVTDKYTTSVHGVKAGTSYTDRLVIVTTKHDRKGRPLTVRADYPGDFQPPLEQLVLALHTIAPQLPISDQRTTA